MITDNKMLHIKAVAEECYRIAIEEYHLTQGEAERAYTIGFVHDIGYAFANESKSHPLKGMEMLNNAFGSMCFEVGAHGNPDTKYQSQYLDILNKADLIVDATGQKVGPIARLKDIGNRYGTDSSQYINAKQLIDKLFTGEEINYLKAVKSSTSDS